jgi:organic radical activating enzyme
MNGIGPLKALPAPMARNPGDFSPPMICHQVFDAISIHANGDIVCWSADVNGQRVYGNVFTDRIADVYNGSAYQEIREWMLRSRPDIWCPAIDSQCSLRVAPAATDQDISRCRIKHLKLESTTYCNLKCPACPVETTFKEDSRLAETRARRTLPLKTMLDVVDQLPDLKSINYFDYGEPFFHKDTIAFLRVVKRTRPGVYIVTSTSGTVITPTQIQAIATEALIDQLLFSIDGATQESYGKYRVGGSFSKAFGKMKALADACRAAGTWRKYLTDPAGVQITWQYILFEWNDSDEEIALARKLAKEIDVPIRWVLTSGYGASKRFLPGSPQTAKILDDPPDFYVALAAQTDIINRLKERGEFISVRCELLLLPYDGCISYKARIRADDSVITVPAGASINFNIDVVNRTGRAWDNRRSDYLRLGCLLKTMRGQTIRELNGIRLAAAAARPGGQEEIWLHVSLPQEPGNYKLWIDVVQEWVCWFSDRGSQPLECTIHVVSEIEKVTAFQRAMRLIKRHPPMIPSWLGRQSSANPRTSTQL